MIKGQKNLMTGQEFEELLALGYERKNVEFKGAGPRSASQLFAKVVRAVLGMSNQQDGGIIVIGVEEDNGVLRPVGVNDLDTATWQYDDVSSSIAGYADPFVSLELEYPEREGKKYVVLHVREFEEIPVICRKDYPGVLRQGACYVRSRRKPETIEIPTQTEMRELLELATKKGIRKFLNKAQDAGFIPADRSADVLSDDQSYAEQLKDIL